MPITPTYPGVYVEEIPSGVHTITGVSTSVTVFVGPAKRGPADKAQNILSFADFERTYGGLLSTSDMTYAVRQFFLNGGSNAWVIRVAKNAKSAAHTFKDSAGDDVLKITALDEGKSGNDITVQIRYPDPDNGRFNLTIFYTASDNPADTRTEQFSNLSMDPNDPRSVTSMVNEVSQLVTVTVESAAQNVTDYTAVRPAETLAHGTLTSGVFDTTDLDGLPAAADDSLQISLDGYPFDTIWLGKPFTGTDLTTKLGNVATQIQAQVRALTGVTQTYQDFTCALDSSKTKLVLTSGTPGSKSSVRIKNAASNDIADTLHLQSGANSVQGTATPQAAGTLTSGTFSLPELEKLPSATQNSLQISLDDDSSFHTIWLGGPFEATGSATKLDDVAQRIQTQVQALKAGNTAYQKFTCTPDTSKRHLVLASGTQGPGSSVLIGNSDLANKLHLSLVTTAIAGGDISKTPGKLISGGFDASNLDGLPGASQNSLQISLDEDSSLHLIVLTAPFTGNDLPTRLADVADRIQTQVRALHPKNAAYQNFICALDTSKTKLVLTSGTQGGTSAVQVSPAPSNDIADGLHLTSAATTTAGTDTPLAAGTLTSGTFSLADLNALPSGTRNSLQISLDGGSPDTIWLGKPFTGSDLPTKLADAADRIQTQVRGLSGVDQTYQDFTCTLDPSKTKLVLTSGTIGSKSVVQVSRAPNNDIASALHLLSATADPANNIALTGGFEDDFSPSDYGVFIGARSLRTGIYALEDVDLFNLLCLPGVTDGGILMDAAAYCQERRAFLIVDAPGGLDLPTMVTTITGPTLPKTNYAAIYYPWVSIADPLNGGKQRLVPPSGTMAGVYARIDSTRGVWKAPAGTEASLVGVQGAERVLTDGQNGILNPHGVNCLRVFPVYGPVSWGARTLRGDDQLTDEYKYIPVRRLALYIEESLYRGTKWAVFEPNDEPLWSQIRLNVGAFMNDLFRKGAFQGRTPRQAYLVKCDSETTTQNDINLGIVNILVGFAPLKPAEFVIIQIQQLAGQIQV